MMISTENRSGAFVKSDTLVNRAAGFLLLAYFSPIIILIAGAMVMRSRQSPVFVGVDLPSHGQSGRKNRIMWRFRSDDNDSSFSRFLTQTRLNLLPQLANVAHGDIPVTTALR